MAEEAVGGCRILPAGGARPATFPDLSEAAETLFPNQPDGSYFAQQTVPVLRTIRNEPVDLRYLVQRDGEAGRLATLAVARVGTASAVTTNLHTGGSPRRPGDVARTLPDRQRTIWEGAVQSGRRVAERAFEKLSELHPGLFELGVDIAIDSGGHPFILEVNPTPGRKMLRILNPEARRLSLERAVEYAVWCAGDSRAGGGTGR